MTLRNRLLSSYLLLLSAALGIFAIALMLLVGARPQPTAPVYSHLTTVLRGLLVQEGMGRGGAGMFSRQWDVESQRGLLDLTALEQDVRIIITTQRGSSAAQVIYDSAELLTVDSDAPVLLPASSELLDMRPVQSFAADAALGTFSDGDGQDWLYSALAFDLSSRFGADFNATLLVADERPQQTFGATLNTVVQQLGLPMIQAALVGLLVAFGLAFWISRSIATPLQQVAQAAHQAAQGHYDQQVPVSGPPEVRAVAEAFNRMSAQVLYAQQIQRDLLANVSHDLKTPLTSIQGFSQAIIDGTARNPAAAAQIIYDEAARLNRMVIELTDLARIQAGRLSFRATAIDMGQIAAAIAQKLTLVARSKQITLHVDAHSMPEIAGDGDRLAQVLDNLISNAIKYTPEGGAVWVQTGIANRGVEVSVRDTGVGIPPEHLPRIFERFYQVDKARGPRRGTGLGLAITREIIQAHGGTIRAYSEGEGKGSTFTIWLPSPHLTTIVRTR